MKKCPLKILMLTEYFYPHDKGGSEWSTYYLAKGLIKKGHKVQLLTPNYGSQSEQTWRKINIHRFSIGKKLKKHQAAITPFWHTNLYWHIQIITSLFKQIKANKPDIIHIQGKYFLPMAVILAKLNRVPTVFTARDYHLLCPLGFCLWQNKKVCNLKKFITHDFKFYLLNYLKKPNFIKIGFLALANLRMRSICFWLKFFAKQCDQVICISQYQQSLFKLNGFKNTQVIYNSTDFYKSPAKKSNLILFAGRLTPGKGAHLLIPAFQKIINHYQFYIIGTGFLKPQIVKQVKKHQLGKKVKIFEHISRSRLLNLMRQAQVVIMPSVWPEPFGRVALEAIAAHTPVVTSDRGGLPEIVQKKYGLCVAPQPQALSKALKTILSSKRFSVQIKNNYTALIDQFVTQPTNQYQSLYFKLLNKT